MYKNILKLRCGPWNSSALIGTVECGIVESHQSHKNTIWSIYSHYGIISAKDRFNNLGENSQLRTKIFPSVPVKYIEKAAVVG